MLLVSCSRQGQVLVEGEFPRDNKGVEIGKWTSEGWAYEETVGDEIPGATAAVHLASDTARIVTACATTPQGEVLRKRFPQDQRRFLIVTMDGEERGTYCLVFSKAQQPGKSD